MFRKLFENAPWKRAIFFIIADAIIFYLSFYMAYLLRFNLKIPPEHIFSSTSLVAPIILIKIFITALFGIYYVTWRYFSLVDVKKILYALVLSDFVFIFYVNFIYKGPFPRTVIVIDFLLSFFLIVALRFSKRVWTEMPTKKGKKRAIIIGANQKALDLISHAKDEAFSYLPVSIVDDDKSFINSYISNIKVEDIKSLENIIDSKNIEAAIVAKEYEPNDLDKLFEKLSKLGVRDLKRFKLLGGKRENLTDISIEELLARKPKDLDFGVIKRFIEDRVVLISGAGGSIGSEIAKQCKKFGAKKILLLDHSEYNLYQINESLEGANKEILLQSVVDRKLLKKSFKKYRPQIVIHAAAYKHVPMCEKNIEGAILNNIIGTKNMIDLSIEYKAQKFVLISTDKAVRPTNVMGTTKRVCELYAQNVDSKDTLITAVRFGNVLGSSGSVIPKFKKQIEENKPLTVTHPDITRYFMLIPEACQLVLQAAAIAKDRELFVLDMGEPVKIVDLAKKMLKLYDKEHLGIKFTSLREGEKLYEELLIDENDKKTIYDSIFVAKESSYDFMKLSKDIENLLQSDDKIVALKKIVPEFQHKDI